MIDMFSLSIIGFATVTATARSIGILSHYPVEP